MPTADPAAVLASALEETSPGALVLVLTGAGVSAASGIPTFRSGPDAIWSRSDVETATEEFFRARPVEHWRWYLERFEGLLEAEPNPAHHALAALERWQENRPAGGGGSGGELSLVTQNIDGLHAAAGSRNLVEVHGCARRLRCARNGCRLGAPAGSLSRDRVDLAPFAADPSPGTLPRCPECGDLLRAHALFFDELYDGHADYRWSRVQRDFERMSLALFVGTSFSVGVTELALRSALFQKVPAYSVDPGGGAGEYPWVTDLAIPAEELLPEVCRRLGIDVEVPA
jgi:NAD-dependent deacetylase